MQPSMLTTAAAVLLSFAVTAGTARGDKADTAAEQPDAQPVEKDTPKDYSGGFSKFYKLGLPDVSGARYVSLETYGFSHSFNQLHELDLQGNAWLVEEVEEGPSLFVVNPCRERRVYDHAQLMKMIREEKGAEKARTRRAILSVSGIQDGRLGGQWQEADLEDDIEKTIAFMEKKLDERQEHDWIFHGGGYGQIFLTAVHYHARGFTTEANRIVEMIFEHAGDRRQVLLEALNKLADAQYDQACDAFFQSGDWQAFREALEALLARFPHGWQYEGAARMLARNIDDRMQYPEPPPVDGEGLTADDKQLAAALAEADNVQPDTRQFMYGSQLLVFPPSFLETNAEAHAVERIRARGMDAIPLLLALLKDDYLTRMDTRKLGGVNQTIYSSFSHDMDGEQDQQRYATMRRPAARSDVAIKLLRPLLITGEEHGPSFREVDRMDVYEDIQDWYAEHKGKSRLELARLYLSEGDNQQKNTAAAYLLAKGTEEDMEALEDQLLEFSTGHQVLMNQSLISRYVAERGQAAADFVAEYERHIETQMEDMEEMFSDEDIRERIKNQVEALKTLVTAQSAEVLLEQVASGEESLSEVWAVLWQRLGKKPQREALRLMLHAATRTEEAAVAGELVGLIPYTENLHTGWSNDPFSDSAGEDDGLPELSAHEEAWRQLLDDQRAVTAFPWSGNAVTVAGRTAVALETLYYPEETKQIQSLFNDLGDQAEALVIERARARLEGRSGDELPPLPSADRVDEERRRALADQLLGAEDSDAVRRAMSAMTLSERMALPDIVEEHGALAERLAPTALTVQVVSPGGLPKDAGDRLQAVEGRRLSRDLLDDLFAEARAASLTPGLTWIQVRRQPLLAGVSIRTGRIDPDEDRYEDALEKWRWSREEDQSAVVGFFYSDEGCDRAIWRNSSKKEPSDMNAATGDEDDDLLMDALKDLDEDLDEEASQAQEEFWASVGAMLAGEGNVARWAEVRFAGVPTQVREPEETGPGDQDGETGESGEKQ